eukprot:CAMPEP_0196660484 /NCGR_PEP_ID=MMETSP1086-20130531/39983_1 /TAXON_ID=77921 /ORGANISM="Cyanoptyche  gloeocystis , Strain SAG4.97" /LENGTH=77 /DNA_ID=CAMNT_0041994915 /DNA_START=151 /DNA_END=380 /DNA_ORIENTATION=-
MNDLPYGGTRYDLGGTHYDLGGTRDDLKRISASCLYAASATNLAVSPGGTSGKSHVVVASSRFKAGTSCNAAGLLSY